MIQMLLTHQNKNINLVLTVNIKCGSSIGQSFYCASIFFIVSLVSLLCTTLNFCSICNLFKNSSFLCNLSSIYYNLVLGPRLYYQVEAIVTYLLVSSNLSHHSTLLAYLLNMLYFVVHMLPSTPSLLLSTVLFYILFSTEIKHLKSFQILTSREPEYKELVMFRCSKCWSLWQCSVSLIFTPTQCFRNIDISMSPLSLMTGDF